MKTFPLILAVVALVFCRVAALPATNDVRIDNFAFAPKVLTVSAGSTVTWVNQDDEPHTVVSTDDRFKSPALDTHEKFTFVFSAPGTYEYFCTLHPHMRGTIVVK